MVSIAQDGLLLVISSAGDSCKIYRVFCWCSSVFLLLATLGSLQIARKGNLLVFLGFSGVRVLCNGYGVCAMLSGVHDSRFMAFSGYV
ncbi:hypothetical protein FF1_029723 [Malus domestica]